MGFNIKAIYTTTAPLSHIKESVSNLSSFQQINIFSDDELIELPIITANSLRGALRNAGAEYILTLLGCQVNKNIFHILFSAGNISSSIVNDIDKSIAIREQHPFVSLFGGCVCDMMLQGKMQFTNLYPIVRETKSITSIDSNISYKQLLSDIQNIKADDSKNDLFAKYIDDTYKEDVKTQMIYETEYLTVGTKLFQQITLKEVNEVEFGCFVATLWNWLKKDPALGGKSNAGFGFFNAVFDFEDCGKIIYENKNIRIDEALQKIMDTYTDFLLSNKDNKEYFDILENKNKSARKK